MNFEDHARGHTPAKKGDHTRQDVTLYHNRCGKRILHNFNGYTCAGICQGGWHDNVMAHFDDDAMATRFHVRTEPDRAEYVIVWKTDDFSKRRYTSLVPTAEAGNLERFKL